MSPDVSEHTLSKAHKDVKGSDDVVNPKVCKSCSGSMAGTRWACAGFCHPDGCGSVRAVVGRERNEG